MGGRSIQEIVNQVCELTNLVDTTCGDGTYDQVGVMTACNICISQPSCFCHTHGCWLLLVTVHTHLLCCQVCLDKLVGGDCPRECDPVVVKLSSGDGCRDAMFGTEAVGWFCKWCTHCQHAL